MGHQQEMNTMKQTDIKYPASQREAALFSLVGEAVCKIQFLEDAINHSIAIKNPKATNRKDADRILDKGRKKNTFGDAVKIIEKKKLLPEDLQNDLANFKGERNWLIHKSMPYHIDELYVEQGCLNLFNRIKKISDTAEILQRAVETEMMEWCVENGMDITNVYNELVRQFGPDAVERMYGLKKPA